MTGWAGKTLNKKAHSAYYSHCQTLNPSRQSLLPWQLLLQRGKEQTGCKSTDNRAKPGFSLSFMDVFEFLLRSKPLHVFTSALQRSRFQESLTFTASGHLLFPDDPVLTLCLWPPWFVFLWLVTGGSREVPHRLQKRLQTDTVPVPLAQWIC